MIERQVIVTWNTPAEKFPKEDISVVARSAAKLEALASIIMLWLLFIIARRKDGIPQTLALIT